MSATSPSLVPVTPAFPEVAAPSGAPIIAAASTGSTTTTNQPTLSATSVPSVQGSLPAAAQETARRVNLRIVVGNIFLILSATCAVMAVVFVATSIIGITQPLWMTYLILTVSAIFFGIFFEILTQELPTPNSFIPVMKGPWYRNPLECPPSVFSSWFQSSPSFQQGQPGIGIRNAGTTCFLNATYQAVRADKELATAIADGTERRAVHWRALGTVAGWLVSMPPPPPSAAAGVILQSQRLGSVVLNSCSAAAEIALQPQRSAPAVLNSFAAAGAASQPQPPAPEVLNSLVYLFSLPEFRGDAQVFRTYATEHADNIAAVQFSQAVARAGERRKRGERFEPIESEVLDILAPLLTLISQEEVLRNRVIAAATREMNFAMALDRYKEFHASYQRALEQQKPIMDGNPTMNMFRSFMPSGDRQGQQDADVLFGQFMDFLEPAQEENNRKFFHTFTLRKHYVAIDEAALRAAAQIDQEFAEGIPLEVQAAREQLARLATARQSLQEHAQDEEFIAKTWGTMTEDGWETEVRPYQHEVGLQLPNPPQNPQGAAPQPPEVLNGQQLFDLHFAEQQVDRDNPVIRLKEDGTLALFRADRQQQLPLEQGQQHLQQRLAFRLNRFYTTGEVDLNPRTQRPVHISRRKNDRVDMPLILQVSGVAYELSAVVCHIGGSVHSGHYTAVVKVPSAVAGQEGQWWLFDDDKNVTPMTAEHRNRYLTASSYGYLYYYRRATQEQAQPAAAEQAAPAAEEEDSVIVKAGDAEDVAASS